MEIIDYTEPPEVDTEPAATSPPPQSLFQMGVAARRAQRPRRPRRAAPTTPPSSCQYPAPPPFQIPRPTWFLLPPIETPPEVYPFLFIYASSLTTAYMWLAYFQRCVNSPPFPTTPFSRSFFRTFPKALAASKNTPFRAYTDEYCGDFQRAIELNQRLRWRLKRFATAWLRRRMRPANTEDLVTMESPKEEVILWDWANRRTYTFEARTILKDSTERLLLHDELWINPHSPRNPFTNLPLTLGQLHHMVASLRAHGRSHWTLDALHRTSYSLPKFKCQFDQPLRHAALDAIFRNPTGDDYYYLMLEFIEQEYEEHGLETFCKPLYSWAIRNAGDDELMIGWRKACRENHALCISITDATELREKQNRVIGPLTAPLCSKNARLHVLRNLWWKTNKIMVLPPASE